MAKKKAAKKRKKRSPLVWSPPRQVRVNPRGLAEDMWYEADRRFRSDPDRYDFWGVIKAFLDEALIGIRREDVVAAYKIMKKWVPEMEKDIRRIKKQHKKDVEREQVRVAFMTALRGPKGPGRWA